MTEFGYTMMCEQSRPDQLVRDLLRAEEAGFGFRHQPPRARAVPLVRAGLEGQQRELLPALRRLP